MRIGVVTPAFNAADCLGDAIRSVVAQSHTDWSMVVVDDGSTDATASVAAAVRDQRLSLIRQANAGVSAARNRGFAATDAEAVLFLDADDWLAPDALARLASALDDSPWAAAAVGPYRFADGTGPARRTRHPRGGDLLEALLRRNRFVNGGHVLIRAEAVKLAGGFDETLSYGEDWAFWVKIALTGEFIAARGASPVLHVRQRSQGAYARKAFDQAAFQPCMTAIFDNPALAARLGRARVADLRRQATAEHVWVAGRELIRHGRQSEGLGLLRRAVRSSPGLRRMALLAAAPVVLHLPQTLRGALRPYPSARAPAANIPDPHGSALAEPCGSGAWVRR